MKWTNSPYTTLEEVIVNQTPVAGGWICEDCKWHNSGGTTLCNKGVFIAFTGANMKGCMGFEAGSVCRHCGKRT